MSATFFQELDIPEPDANLEVGSGAAVWQVTEVMRRMEKELQANRPDVVTVVGDVNSTLAAALVATKLDLPLAHVEAGLRSFDRTMPEEVNRVVTDALATWLFTSEPSGDANLLREGIARENIHFVGNVMIDTVLLHLERARRGKPYQALGLEPQKYILLTLHRPSNVDSRHHLTSILRAVSDVSQRLPVVFPIHPRTRMRMEEFGLDNRNELIGLRMIDPQGYLATLGLIDSARLVLTDSGGIQEETTALQIPCLTLRENTERPITVEIGSNRLVGWRTEDILTPAHAILDDRIAPVGQVPAKWDGRAAERIAHVFQRALAE